MAFNPNNPEGAWQVLREVTSVDGALPGTFDVDTYPPILFRRFNDASLAERIQLMVVIFDATGKPITPRTGRCNFRIVQVTTTEDEENISAVSDIIRLRSGEVFVLGGFRTALLSAWVETLTLTGPGVVAKIYGIQL